MNLLEALKELKAGRKVVEKSSGATWSMEAYKPYITSSSGAYIYLGESATTVGLLAFLYKDL